MAVPTGFEPALSALTGPRVWPGYTTGPAAAKSTNGLNSARFCMRAPLTRKGRSRGLPRGQANLLALTLTLSPAGRGKKWEPLRGEGKSGSPLRGEGKSGSPLRGEGRSGVLRGGEGTRRRELETPNL